jgi:hypothetical protein
MVDIKPVIETTSAPIHFFLVHQLSGFAGSSSHESHGSSAFAVEGAALGTIAGIGDNDWIRERRSIESNRVV